MPLETNTLLACLLNWKISARFKKVWWSLTNQRKLLRLGTALVWQRLCLSDSLIPFITLKAKRCCHPCSSEEGRCNGTSPPEPIMGCLWKSRDFLTSGLLSPEGKYETQFFVNSLTGSTPEKIKQKKKQPKKRQQCLSSLWSLTVSNYLSKVITSKVIYYFTSCSVRYQIKVRCLVKNVLILFYYYLKNLIGYLKCWRE